METDVLPGIPTDFPIGRDRLSAVIRLRMSDAKEFRVVKAPDRRVFRLIFANRNKSAWDVLKAFYLAHRDEYITWIDPENGRRYTVYFATDPRFAQASHARRDISIELVEAVDAPLGVYPQTPLVMMSTSRFLTGMTAKIVAYRGYGFSMVASGVTNMKVDGVSVGATAPVWNIKLGLHRLEVLPKTADISAFGFVP